MKGGTFCGKKWSKGTFADIGNLQMGGVIQRTLVESLSETRFSSVTWPRPSIHLRPLGPRQEFLISPSFSFPKNFSPPPQILYYQAKIIWYKFKTILKLLVQILKYHGT